MKNEIFISDNAVRDDGTAVSWLGRREIGTSTCGRQLLTAGMLCIHKCCASQSINLIILDLVNGYGL
jgi:hypothetical protein